MKSLIHLSILCTLFSFSLCAVQVYSPFEDTSKTSAEVSNNPALALGSRKKNPYYTGWRFERHRPYWRDTYKSDIKTGKKEKGCPTCQRRRRSK